jgi:hypothetical protein
MRVYWFPAYGHPDGASSRPAYRVIGDDVFALQHGGADDAASFRIAGDAVYPARGQLVEPAPAFEIIGTFIYPVVGGTGHGSGPWYRALPVPPSDVASSRGRR